MKKKNRELTLLITEDYSEQDGIIGYRQMTIKLNRENEFRVNHMVFQTFELAHQKHPNVKPIFHNDRGFKYTSKLFRKKLDDAEMTQSMSRVGRCIDNGPMETSWGILKTEMYNLKQFHTFEELKNAVDEYIEFYSNRRYQKRLNCMTPLEYREYLFTNAA